MSGRIIGLLRPSVDMHTLGVSTVHKLLEECGISVAVPDRTVSRAAGQPSGANCGALLASWVAQEQLTELGFSYRLDPADAADLFGCLVRQMKARGLFAAQGGRIRHLYFAGLPAACERVKAEHGGLVTVFCGDESPSETLAKLGAPRSRWPAALVEEHAYDKARFGFGSDLVGAEMHRSVVAPPRDYPEYGTRRDTLVARLRYREQTHLPPLMRAHAGPYSAKREVAIGEFLQWCRSLASAGFLDVLSIGSSQLTQERFGENWGKRRNGGGLPVNSAEEYTRIWEAARPMLVRTYAGTTNIPQLARMYEETLNMAWHALSLWWFSQLDGRGPCPLGENLRAHFAALEVIAASGKPYEANVSHHFAFRGGDDATYVASGVLAARLAKQRGIRTYVLQNMLNTPKSTWGVQDLAKARTLLKLVRDLEDASFRVVYQPRAGLDYLSHDLSKAKAQLAAVSALMDDVEPQNPMTPEVIHVVSYSEGAFLANPELINESIQITTAALQEYRKLRHRGDVEDMTKDAEVESRTRKLTSEVTALLDAMERTIPALYSPQGLEIAFRAGFLPVPHLSGCRDDFPCAVSTKTQLVDGSVHVVTDCGDIMSCETRIGRATEAAREMVSVLQPWHRRATAAFGDSSQQQGSK